jgi:hypothetical protein
MKFNGTPNQLIKMVYRIGIARKTKSIGRFDKDGIFETEDANIIKRMTKHFTEQVFHIIEDKEIIRHCKKCSFTCTNQGELMKHYREEHPKGEQIAVPN